MGTSYRKIHKPSHPRADILGFVGEHILVMEEKLDRPIVKGEIVHHKDFHKPNNDPENLLLMTRAEHQQFPMWQARFILEQGLYDKFLWYWQACKDQPDLVRELEREIVEVENKRARAAAKLKAHEGVDESV